MPSSHFPPGPQREEGTTATSLVHPQATVQGPVRLTEPCFVGAGAVLEGPLEAGTELFVSPGAFVGGPAQHRAGGRGSLVLGDRVSIREAATIHRGSEAGTGVTRVGDDALIMAYAHVGHDACLGCRVVVSNGVQIGGHVEVGDDAVLGARAALHQFVRIGEGAMVAAGSMVSGDVPPYTTVAGDRARVIGANRKALERMGEAWASRWIAQLLRWHCPGPGKRSPGPKAIDQWLIEDERRQSSIAVGQFLSFVKAPSRRSLCPRSR